MKPKTIRLPMVHAKLPVVVVIVTYKEGFPSKLFDPAIEENECVMTVSPKRLKGHVYSTLFI